MSRKNQSQQPVPEEGTPAKLRYRDGRKQIKDTLHVVTKSIDADALEEWLDDELLELFEPIRKRRGN